MVDAFQDAGLKIFGPTRAAAQLEASKDFAKSFMARHGIPTALHRTFDSADEAKAYVAEARRADRGQGRRPRRRQGRGGGGERAPRRTPRSTR